MIASPRGEEENVAIQFLFRKSQKARAFTPSTDHPREEKTSKEWTNKLASLVEEESADDAFTSKKTDDPERLRKQRSSSSSSYFTSLRLEGPYFTPANPEKYSTVICIVAGTGISGAIAIAAAFSAQPRTADSRWKRCVVAWSVREPDYIKLPFFQEETPGLEVRPHLTGKGQARLDAMSTIRDVCGSEPPERTWVYLSGPNPFIEAGEKACRAAGVPYYGARWS